MFGWLLFFATVTNKLSRHAGHSSGQTVAELIALSLFPCVHCLDLILEVERSEAIGRRSVKHQLSFFCSAERQKRYLEKRKRQSDVPFGSGKEQSDAPCLVISDWLTAAGGGQWPSCIFITLQHWPEDVGKHSPTLRASAIYVKKKTTRGPSELSRLEGNTIWETFSS